MLEPSWREESFLCRHIQQQLSSSCSFHRARSKESCQEDRSTTLEKRRRIHCLKKKKTKKNRKERKRKMFFFHFSFFLFLYSSKLFFKPKLEMSGREILMISVLKRFFLNLSRAFFLNSSDEATPVRMKMSSSA